MATRKTPKAPTTPSRKQPARKKPAPAAPAVTPTRAGRSRPSRVRLGSRTRPAARNTIRAGKLVSQQKTVARATKGNKVSGGSE